MTFVREDCQLDLPDWRGGARPCHFFSPPYLGPAKLMILRRIKCSV